MAKEPTIKERLDKIEQFLFGTVKHELFYHRVLLIIILTAIIGSSIALLFRVG